MLKILLPILFLVSLVAVWLNFDFSEDVEVAPSTIEKKIETIEEPSPRDTPPKKVHLPITPNIASIKDTDNSELQQKVQTLLQHAKKLLLKDKFAEALKIYDEIIEKTKKSKDLVLLKAFARACKEEAYIYSSYPNYDTEASLEFLNMILKKFETSDKSELLGIYIDTKIQLAYLTTNQEDRIELYDELIQKFQNHDDEDLQKKLEDILIEKSFELMGKNDNEAIEILDNLIEKYSENKEGTLPENISISILNSIELSIITNNDDQKYRDLAEKYLSTSDDTKPLLDMLNIIRESQEIDQKSAFEEWKKEHDDYRFPDWSFQELRRWMMNIEDSETKSRVMQTLDSFENYKYNIEEQSINTKLNTTPSENENSEENPNNSYGDPYSEETETSVDDDADEVEDDDELETSNEPENEPFIPHEVEQLEGDFPKAVL